MEKKDILTMSIFEISNLIKTKQISPVELVEKAIERTNLLENDLGAYITFLPEKAMESAKIAEQEIIKNGPKSLLHGIPFAVKDLFYTKGILTTAGSKILSDYEPSYDSTVVERLYKAGAVLMGKNNLHKWAIGGSGDSYYVSTRNPWDISRTPGGSSGGSAVAVASGMVYMAMGTDTGGSIRIPSSFCGVVGLKPTNGIVSLYGVIPISLMFDHAGPIARSVIDIAITMDLITGYDPNDPWRNRYKGSHTNFFTTELKEIDNLKGLTIGIPSSYFFDGIDSEVKALVENFISDLTELGADIKHISIPNLDIVTDISTKLIYSEAIILHKDYLATYPDEYSIEEKLRLEQAIKYTASDYILALRQRDKIIDSWNQIISHVDVVIAPTVSFAPFKKSLSSDMIFPQEKRSQTKEMLSKFVKNTRFANTTGCPALSVPCGFTSEGLPVGAMIMGREYEDFTLLKVGYAYEKHKPFLLKNY